MEFHRIDVRDLCSEVSNHYSRELGAYMPASCIVLPNGHVRIRDGRSFHGHVGSEAVGEI